MTRREWLARAGRALPFLSALPAVLSRAPALSRLPGLRWEWEERGMMCFATLVRLPTGELRAALDRFSPVAWRWGSARQFHRGITAQWITRGAPLSHWSVETMRDLLAHREFALDIARFAAQHPSASRFWFKGPPLPPPVR